MLDTNTLISALLGRDSTPAKVLAEILSGTAENYTSPEILNEVRDVLSRPKIAEKTAEHERNRFLRIISSVSKIVTPRKRLEVIVEDPADNRILECALEAKAHYVISGDRHLLRLRKYKKTTILNSSEFLKKHNKR